MNDSKKNVAAIYGLSPLQKGMLHHSLLEPHSGVYTTQQVFDLQGALNLEAFEQAWTTTIARHDIFRTMFLRLDTKKPVQIVRKDAVLPWRQIDFREFGEAERNQRFDALMEADRVRGFTFSKAPIMRLILVRMDEAHYRLIWTRHHAITDGWTTILVLKEVLTHYNATLQGTPAALPTAKPYGGYIRWLGKQDLEASKRFWEKDLAGFTHTTPLGIDHPQSSDDPRQKALGLTLSAAETTQVQDLARREGITLNVLAQGVWALLLSRFSGRDQVLFGATVSGRPPELPGIESMVGPFINTLPVRCALPPGAVIREWLKDLHVRQVERIHYDYTPLVDIHQWSDIPSGTPLFESIVVFENFPLDESLTDLVADLKIAPYEGFSPNNLPLTLRLVRRGDHLSVEIIYKTRRFEAASIDMLSAAFRKILLDMVAHPERTLDSLQLLSPETHQRVVVDWNQTHRPYPAERCAHTLIEGFAAQRPDAPALIFHDVTLTYGELNRRAAHCARYLVEAGVGAESLVGLYASRSPEWLIALLGVLKAGGAFVPMATNHPVSRIADITREYGLTRILAMPEDMDTLAGHDLPITSLTTDWAEVSDENTALPAQTSSDQLAYVIFTSGSTGKPKGVGISHKALHNYVQGVVSKLGLTETDDMSALATPAADLANTSLFGALLTGRPLRLFREELSLNADDLALELANQPSACLKVVPTHLTTLMAVPLPERLIPTRCLVLGGEALNATLIQRVHDMAPQCRIVNHYGPTEATVGALTYQADPDKHPSGAIPIGRPLPNYRAYILDSRMTPQSPAAAGELFIGGDSLARGYLGQSARTAQSFLPDPFSGEEGGRIYRTGDLVRFRDEDIVFVGRADHQIKIRGFRVELGEIETTLRGLDGVDDCVVSALGDGAEKRLVGYVVLGADSGLDLDQITTQLSATLPEYMIPTQLMILPALPFTPNGKIDRKALPKPDNAPTDQAAGPRNDLEAYLQALYQDVLDMETVGVHDSFFAIGGHSLLATLVLTQARAEYDVDLNIRDLFENPSVSAFAQRIQAMRAEVTADDEPQLQPVPRQDRLPLSYSQQRLWVLDQLEEDKAGYNVYGILRITGDLQPHILDRALQEVVRRHEILRTRFVAVDGEGAQEIADHLPLPLIRRNLTEAEVPAFITAEMNHPFLLGRLPLMRVSLGQLHEDQAVLVLTMHHIISDRWSIGILIKEMIALYQAYLAGTEPSVPELSVQYADYAHWQRACLSGDSLEQQLAFWRENLEGHPPLLNLPLDHPRPAVRTNRGAEASVHLNAQISEQLNALARKHDATLFMALLAAFDVLLYRYSGQTDIVVGSPVANRTRDALEPMIGFFVNTLVLRNQLRPDASFEDLLEQVRENTLKAFEHQETPFELIVDALQPERSLSHAPIFQVMLVLQNTPFTALEVQGLHFEPLKQPGSVVKFDMTLILTETDQGLTGVLQYSTELFEHQTMVRLVDHLGVLLEAIVARPKTPLRLLPLLPSSERTLLLDTWGRTQSEPVPAPPIHGQFEHWVRETPHAVAVACGEDALTYVALNRRANQIAHQLLLRGLKPSSPVGLRVTRSLDIAIGILAILKAGGAYVPIDPTYPEDRQSYMIDDAGIRFLLTQSFIEDQGEVAQNVERIHVERIHVEKIFIDQDAEDLPTDNPDLAFDGAEAAYLIYTSGSTGRPKGVVVSHRNLVSSTQARINYYGALADCFLLLSSYAFDSSVAGVFGTLCGGGKLVLGDPKDDPLAIMEEIRRWDVTQTLCLPSLYNALLDLVAGEWPLRSVVVAGEACANALLEKHRRIAPATTLFNEYGPTEGTVWCSVHEWDGAMPETTLPIGRPVAGSQLYVLDPAGNLAPTGVPGELFLGGENVARGYHGRPCLTAARFTPDPFGSDGGRVYRTGDLVRFQVDGELEFLGRNDHQVKIRGFRVEPGEIENALSGHPEVTDAAVVVKTGNTANTKFLTGYFTTQASATLTPTDLRDYLSQNLPDYMVPTFLIPLETMPLTANGKVDRNALPEPEHTETDARDYSAPRNETEFHLTKIWAELLGVEKVGIQDNFFQLGGDSIIAIQVIARANRLGLGLSPRQLFEHQTIAELSAVVQTGTPMLAEQGLVSGALPLTPIHHWFFTQQLVEAHHWNQSVLLDVARDLDLERFNEAVGLLFHHHDALRTRVEQSEGDPRLIIESSVTPPTMAHQDLSAFDADRQDQELATHTAALQASMHLAQSPLMALGYFDLGADRGGRLLIAAHHLLVDGVTWRVLLEDLNTAYAALIAGKQPILPPKTSAFQAWATRLNDHAQSPALLSEQTYWRSLNEHPFTPLPKDRDGHNLVATERVFTTELDTETTRAVLQDIAPRYHTEINDVLLFALSETCHAWTGHAQLWVSLEGHGREASFDDLDVTRTAGWFTSEYPLVLARPEGDTGAVLKSIKEQLRQIPNRGVGFGLLRYLHQDEAVRNHMAALPHAELSFNYLGQFARNAEDTGAFAIAAESAGPNHAAAQTRPYPLAVTALVTDQGNLRVQWRYSEALHHETTIQQLANGFTDALKTLISHCRQDDAGGYTPSDFPDADLDQSQLDALVDTLAADAARDNLEAIFPLSAQQHGMIFHTLTEPDSDVFLWQLACELNGLDVEAFKTAWARVADHHTVFRTLFWNYRSERPLQVVRKQVDLPWIEHDWRNLAADELETRFQKLLKSDEARNFDFAKAPVLGLFLIRTDEQTYRFVWSQHHALGDGWSHPIVLRDLFAAYEAGRQGREWNPPRPKSYQAYIRWLNAQDHDAAAAFWRTYLGGVTRPTALGIDQTPGQDQPLLEEERQLSEVHTEHLNTLVRAEKLTANIVVQGMWTVLLSRYSGQRDVLYGTVTSGRPAELVGVEDMVGPFVNALPVRASVDPDKPALAWLADLHQSQIKREQATYLPLADIQKASDVPRGTPLFELLVQAQNYPMGDVLSSSGLDIRILDSFEKNNYPFTLKIIGGARLTLEITYQPGRFEMAAVKRVLAHLHTLIEDLIQHPGKTIGELAMETESERQAQTQKKEKLKAFRSRSLRNMKRKPVSAQEQAD